MSDPIQNAAQSSDATATKVLELAGFRSAVTCTRVHGGFSDATVWRVESPPATFALKAYPTFHFSPNGLREIHDLLQKGRDAGIHALPRVCRPWLDQTWINHAGALWDMVSWQQGAPTLAESPTQSKLAVAGATLARLHMAWKPEKPLPQVPACVERRLQLFNRWPTLRKSQLNSPLLEDIRDTICWLESTMRTLLAPWQTRATAVQPCLGDLWNAHLLYTGDDLTGLIDHAAIRIDQPATDLARLLGSLDLTNEQRVTLLDAYGQHRRLTEEEFDLLRVLEPTGIVGGLIHWQERLVQEHKLTPESISRIEFLVRKARTIV